MLFERCLIASAHGEEIWLTDIQYFEKSLAGEYLTASHIQVKLRAAYGRDCSAYRTRSLTAHLMWTKFEEKNWRKSDG